MSHIFIYDILADNIFSLKTSAVKAYFDIAFQVIIERDTI